MYQDILNTEPYGFIHKEANLGSQLLYLTLSGSIGYGTNLQTSDIDLRGFAIEQKAVLFGFDEFEQYEELQTDTVIFGLKKFMSLAQKANPNILELLNTNEEHVLYMHPLGKQIRDHRHLFLSKRMVQTFGNYASAQLKRLQNALARDHYPTAEKEAHMLEALKRQIQHFEQTTAAFDKGAISVSIGALSQQLEISAHIEGYPLRDFAAMNSQMQNLVRSYEQLNHRNRKKTDTQLNKHAMHLVRLLLMGTEALKTGEMHTHRQGDLDFLMSIRHGELSYDAFMGHVEKCEQAFFQAARDSSLPDHPDEKRIEALMMSTYEGFYYGT